MLVQLGLCRTCSETTLLVFPVGGSYLDAPFIQFITTSIDDILRDSGTSKKEVEDALDSLQNANDDLKEIIDEFGDYAANMTDIISALAQAQIGESLCTFDIDNYLTMHSKVKQNRE